MDLVLHCEVIACQIARTMLILSTRLFSPESSVDSCLHASVQGLQAELNESIGRLFAFSSNRARFEMKRIVSMSCQ